MPTDVLDLAPILERLANLERQNRRMKQLGLLLLVAAAAVVWMGQARAIRPNDARNFVVRDAKAKKRAELTVLPAGPALVLYDEAERMTAAFGSYGETTGILFNGPRLQRSVALEITAAGPNLSMYSAAGVRRLNVGVLGQGPNVGILGPSGEAKGSFGVSGDNAFLHLFAAKEHGGAQLYSTADRAVLRFFDMSDRPRAVLGLVERDNSPGLVFNDPNGSARALFMITPSGPVLDMFDGSRHSIWHAP